MGPSIRLFTLTCAVALSLGSAGSNRQAQPQQGQPGNHEGGGGGEQFQEMDFSKALGLWKSSFGAVKIEADPDRPGSVRGIWLYDRNGEEVIGYFTGAFSGNALSFSWEEPTTSGAPLVGGGSLTFDLEGRSFQGKWWTTNRDRFGDWSGWRADGAPAQGGPAEAAPPPDRGLDEDDDEGDEGDEPRDPRPNGDFI